MSDHVVIMAGGSGTRFWPASRRARPKQFLPIGAPNSLLAQTLERVSARFPADRRVIVTGAAHAGHAADEAPGATILVEPAARNTAACIGWASRHVAARDPDAVLAVLPSDHFVSDPAAFDAHLGAAIEAARAHRRIVLLGLVPTRPETGYGYIERAEPAARAEGLELCGVRRFVEKPDRETALSYLAAGTYLWNSGMFVFPADVMNAAIRAHVPELAAGLDRLEGEGLDAVYPKLPSISIDYAVMEKQRDLLVLPSTFPWSDVGSWDAASELYAPDARGNVLLGDAIAVDAGASYVDARGGRAVALVGVEDLLVVDTKDAVLIVRRGKGQDVKKVVDELAKVGRLDLL